jgi:hypothetical protein
VPIATRGESDPPFQPTLATKRLIKQQRANELAIANVAKLYSGFSTKKLIEQQRASELAMAKVGNVAKLYSDLSTKKLIEQQRASELAMANVANVAKLYSDLSTKKLIEQLRASNLAAASSFRIVTSVAAASTPAGFRPDPLADVSDPDARLYAFIEWYLGLPANHRRAILDSFLTVLLAACFIVQATVPQRVPAVLLEVLTLITALMRLVSTISDANDE